MVIGFFSRISFFITKICWRLQFKKVKVHYDYLSKGRCLDCGACNDKNIIECSYFYCPCNKNQQLKRKRKFNWIYEKFKKI